jgi:hypothetical protein
MASGVSIVYALRIKDEPRRHDLRLSRPITGRGPAYLPPPSEVTPHPVPLADDVDHDPPHIAMVSGDYRLLPDCLPIVFRGEGRHAAIATFRLEVMYHVQPPSMTPTADTQACSGSVKTQELPADSAVDELTARREEYPCLRAPTNF